jgi:hypothetical protein
MIGPVCTVSGNASRFAGFSAVAAISTLAMEVGVAARTCSYAIPLIITVSAAAIPTTVRRWKPVGIMYALS